MGRKLSVSQEDRRVWLRRQEMGESVPDIAKSVGYDVRTVRNMLAREVQDRENREAKQVVLRSALEKHYSDLCEFAQRLKGNLPGSRDFGIMKADPLWSALKQHLPRSPMWKNTERWEVIEKRTREINTQFNVEIRQTVIEKLKLEFARELNGPSLQDPGILQALEAHFSSTAWGNPRLFDDFTFKEVPVGDGTSIVSYGGYTVGRIPESMIKKLERDFLLLMSEVATGSLNKELADLYKELARIRDGVNEELLVIILRRVVPGKCKYCPL